ncbi:MAG: hypothetical protein V4794_16975 [Pseudomonadota bacterium]
MKTSTQRAPLSRDELGRLSADDVFRLKLSEMEFSTLRQIDQELAIERAERSARLSAEEAPLAEDLRAVGLSASSAWDLVNSKEPYSQAVPVLLKHLQRPYSDRIREGIARALAIPQAEVQENWTLLVAEYCRASFGRGVVAIGDTKEYRLGAKDGLAVALSAAATDDRLPELIALAEDPIHGESRILLLSALKKRRKKNRLVQEAIPRLSRDPELSKELASWK